jgi:hypothetical protein
MLPQTVSDSPAHRVGVDQLLKRYAVIHIGRGHFNGADQFVFLVGVDMAFVAVKPLAVLHRPAGITIRVGDALGVPVGGGLAVIEPLSGFVADARLGHLDNGGVNQLSAFGGETGSGELVAHFTKQGVSTAVGYGRRPPCGRAASRPVAALTAAANPTQSTRCSSLSSTPVN